MEREQMGFELVHAAITIIILVLVILIFLHTRKEEKREGWQ